MTFKKPEIFVGEEPPKEPALGDRWQNSSKFTVISIKPNSIALWNGYIWLLCLEEPEKGV